MKLACWASFFRLFIFDDVKHPRFLKDPKTLQETNQVFETILNSCTEGIIMVNGEGIIVLANPICESLFGYKAGELAGEKIEILVPTVQRKAHRKDRNDYHKKPTVRKMGQGRDLRGQRKDGSVFPVEISLSPTKIDDRFYTLAFISDISERKAIEDELAQNRIMLEQYTAQLEERVKERTEALERANLALESEIKEKEKAELKTKEALKKEKELNSLKSRFISAASHEFRTPLSTILSSATLIGKYRHEQEQERREKHINRIKTSVNNLNGILEEFLSYEKLEAGKVLIKPTQFDLVKLVKEVIEELNAIAKKNQHIFLESVHLSLEMYTDHHMIKNVLINIISNAIKYSPENRPIFISLGTEDESTIITIEDQGYGIPEEDQPHLFERFFRGSNATNIQGTGLGMNIVKKYLQVLRGKIDFTSVLNEGTEFILQIPIVHPVYEKDSVD